MKKAFLVPFFTMFVLAACGDDDSSSSVDEGGASGGIASVATYDDLAHCTKSHYGEVVYVEDEDTYFECTSDDWTEVDSAAVDSILATTSSSSAAEDSVKSSSSIKADSSETADVETVKVDSVTVSGFAQKGPFESGATVTVYGLDSLLEKTKTKFSGKVTGDSGAFSVSKVVLPSQYALVEVNGFYMNENSGKKTSGTKLTLGALVDLSEGKSVKANVNVFTELEYARAKRLVLKEKFNVPAAKKRATKELLSVFGGKGDDLTATSLSLSDTSSAGKALLVAGILLQGELSASKFGSMLDDVADLFAAKGNLDSAELRADLADWASKADSADAYASIRNNVKALKLMASVPDFENFLYGFWTAEYKLGACTDSLEETIKKNENKLSDNYGVGYACTAKRWHKATALDTDLGLCTGKMEGTFKEYKGGRETEYYVCKSGTWNKITATQYELKECTESIELKYVATKSKEYFVCTDKQWVAIDSITYELKLCTDKRDKELAKTAKGASYVCQWDGEEGSWRKPTDIEAELGVCGGKEVKLDTIYKTKTGEYYTCTASGWEKVDELSALFGKCNASLEDSVRWSGAFLSDADGKPLGYGNMPADTVGAPGKYYECHNSQWKESDLAKYVYGVDCSENTIFGLTDSEIMSKFIEMKMVDGKLEPKNGVDALAYYLAMGIILSPDSLMYVQCKNENWESIDQAFYMTRKECSAEIDSTILNGYACVHEGSNYYWRETTAAENATGKLCNNKILGISGDYVCEKKNGIYQWRNISTAEKVNGKLCDGSGKTEILNGYVCQAGDTNWRAANSVEQVTDTVCGKLRSNDAGVSTENNKHLFAGNYVCTKEDDCLTPKINGYCWRKGTAGEIATGTICQSALKDSVRSGYVCNYKKGWSGAISGYRWREASSSEIIVGKSCHYDKDDYYSPYKMFAYGNGVLYRCTDSTAHAWTQYTFQTITDTRDGRRDVYRYVDIGDTVVMVDNLKFRHAEDSLANWKCYDNLGANCEKYGALYTWSAAVAGNSSEPQGACPNGWHVPNRLEGTWLWNQKNKEGVGFPQYMKETYDPEPYLLWWTSTSKNSSFAYVSGVTSSSDTQGYYDSKSDFNYVRCIKDY